MLTNGTNEMKVTIPTIMYTTTSGIKLFVQSRVLFLLLAVSAILTGKGSSGSSHEEFPSSTSTSNSDSTTGGKGKGMKIAIIGGGISGTFVTKYLVDYDVNCTMFSTITIFDPYPIVRNNNNNTNKDTEGGGPWKNQHLYQQQHANQQGSRISSYEMEIDYHLIVSKTNNTSVSTATNSSAKTTTASTTNDRPKTKISIELGASILYKSFFHVIEMIQNDTSIRVGPPFTTGNDTVDATISDPTSMGIYNNGNTKDKEQKWSILTSTISSPYLRKLYLLLRYNWDLIKLSNVCNNVNDNHFALLPYMLSNENQYIYDSPKQIWDSISLYTSMIVHTFDTLLDVVGIASSSFTPTSTDSYIKRVRKYLSYLWYNTIPYQGLIRDELLTAINLNTYNQNNTQVNAITGLGSLAAALGSNSIFSIKGGNDQIIASAYHQAKNNREKYCTSTNPTEPTPTVNIMQNRIVTVVGDIEGLALFAENNTYIGEYDIVILAVPLQFSQINFLIESSIDPSILLEMPLGGRINAHHRIVDKDRTEDEEHEGHVQLPHPVPDTARRPYVQVVTTIVREATINHTFFHIEDPKHVPRTILMTSNGQYRTYNITTITLIVHGIYKVFSSNPLSDSTIQTIFGSTAVVEYEYIWGGLHGGATPNYLAYDPTRGGHNTTNFLLYDGAIGMHGHTKSGAVYYTNTMEQMALSCMEISAIGAKAVAKLIAERVGLINERPVNLTDHDDWNDEL